MELKDVILATIAEIGEEPEEGRESNLPIDAEK